jgi:hypothetical protein
MKEQGKVCFGGAKADICWVKLSPFFAFNISDHKC